MPRLDLNGYPLDPYNEVIPRLAQASSWISPVVVGRTLIAVGHRPSEAIELIRAARGPRALFNGTFEAFLLERCTPMKLASLAEPRKEIGVSPR